MIKRVITILPLVILTLLAILSFTGRLRFGFGLGDMLYHGIILLGLIVYGVYFLIRHKIPNTVYLVFPIIAIAFCGYLLLSLTFWRGSEYKWDGDILAPTERSRAKRKNAQFEYKRAKIKAEIEKAPLDYDLRIELGLHCRRNGKHKLAIEAFKEAQAVAPLEYRAYGEAAYAYGLMKDFENMIRETEKSYLIDTTNTAMKERLDELIKMHQKK